VKPSPRQWTLVALAAVLAAGAVGLLARSKRQAPRTRYDCLIIRSLTGRDNVVTSRGFPAYYPPDASSGKERSVVPAASREAQLLGTHVRVTVYDTDDERARVAVDAALERIAELSAKLNIFDPASAVSRLNQEAHRAPMAIDDDLARLIAQSQRVARLSGGAFDATVGPLTALWREYRRAGRLPPLEEVKQRTERVDYRLVELGAPPTVRFAREGMSFDFGGIAKGFAADEAAEVLTRHGVRSAIIDCGGDLKLVGSRPGGEPFRVGVDEPNPDAASPLRFLLHLSDTSVVTSGNYRQFTMIAGRRCSHIIDPRTGESIEALPSVTVIGPNSTLCDALATAISVLGEEDGLELIQRVNAAPAEVQAASWGQFSADVLRECCLGRASTSSPSMR